MRGDRGRAAAHGGRMELEVSISRGDRHCNLIIDTHEISIIV
jgi:hypothetical protein